MKLDSHQHFWKYSQEEYDWIGDTEVVLKRDFLPADLAPILSVNNLDGCIAVQARQTDEETEWLIELAKNNSIVKGVVGWIDLKSPVLSHTLKKYKSDDTLKGFRHVLQGEVSEFMLASDFIRGLKVLEQHDYSYDILVFAHQLPQTIELVQQLPHLRLVVDHIAKPAILKNEGFVEWKSAMTALAEHPNVYCKVSGMVTEADVNNWQQDEFTKYLDVIFSVFGGKRIMFGSDWPVCLLAGEYKNIKKIVEDYVNQHYPTHYEDVFGLNAATFYQIA